MNTKEERSLTKLGLRIGLIFLAAFAALFFVAYVVISKDVQGFLTDYTITMVQSMANQGVTTIEYELRTSRKAAAVLAAALPSNTEERPSAALSAVMVPQDALRVVYVGAGGTFSSDGRQRDLSARQDIITAFGGEAASYGPYYNEEDEYVICYSAPVIRDGGVAGVVSVEKDGYYFCELIKDIRFVDTGESYIIDAEGTDIAVSDPHHIDWVTGRYNARDLLEEQEDPTTRSILELEEKGLAGESGMGTYYWEDGLCYVVYRPIPSVGWVLLAGLRQEELTALTRSALYASIAEGPTLGVCIVVFLILVAIIFVWVLTSMRKNVELNKRLDAIANYDALTGIHNRNSYHAALDAFPEERLKSLACLYIDANGLHELNNHLGHQAGDQMLKAVAVVLRDVFGERDVYRIGGDEFLAFCRDRKEQEISDLADRVRQELQGQNYELSIGIEWRDRSLDIQDMVNRAEEAMQRDKQRYYSENGKERQLRYLNQALERLVLEKQDADAFLAVLAPEFNGVYFVDLNRDTVRHLLIPDDFEEMLKESGDRFSKALRLYTERTIKPEYRQQMERFCDYGLIKTLLEENAAPEITYQKTDGVWMRLRILKFKTYTEQNRETLWIFTKIESSP